MRGRRRVMVLLSVRLLSRSEEAMSTRHGIVVAAIVALLSTLGASDATARAKKSAAAPKAPPRAVNACGCYADLEGKCFCPKRGKCGCPGECEPKGCDDKRARQMQKEIAAETKKAAEIDRKARQSEKERAARPDPEPKPKAADEGAAKK